MQIRLLRWNRIHSRLNLRPLLAFYFSLFYLLCRAHIQSQQSLLKTFCSSKTVLNDYLNSREGKKKMHAPRASIKMGFGEVFLPYSSKFRSNPQCAHTHRISAYQQSSLSLRAAISLMLTDVICRLEIGFATVAAEEFLNGLRCNRQILYLKRLSACQSYISAFLLHG